MKRVTCLAMGWLMLSAAALTAATTPAAPVQKFYGKIISVEQTQRSVTVKNKKRQLEQTFTWDQDTAFLFNKNPIPASDLKTGQFLVISYVADQGINRATRIQVRTPFKKNASQKSNE